MTSPSPLHALRADLRQIPDLTLRDKARHYALCARLCEATLEGRAEWAAVERDRREPDAASAGLREVAWEGVRP